MSQEIRLHFPCSASRFCLVVAFIDSSIPPFIAAGWKYMLYCLFTRLVLFYWRCPPLLGRYHGYAGAQIASAAEGDFLIICDKRRHIKMVFIGNCQIVLFCIVLVLHGIVLYSVPLITYSATSKMAFLILYSSLFTITITITKMVFLTLVVFYIHHPLQRVCSALAGSN